MVYDCDQPIQRLSSQWGREKMHRDQQDRAMKKKKKKNWMRVFFRLLIIWLTSTRSGREIRKREGERLPLVSSVPSFSMHSRGGFSLCQPDNPKQLAYRKGR